MQVEKLKIAGKRYLCAILATGGAQRQTDTVLKGFLDLVVFGLIVLGVLFPQILVKSSAPMSQIIAP